MTKQASSILPFPLFNVVERRTEDVSRDRLRGWEIAGALFDAGCIKIAIAELPVYRGSIHQSSTHWFHLVVQGKMEFCLGQDKFIADSGDLVFVPAGEKMQRTGLTPLVLVYIEIEDMPLWNPLKSLGHSVRRYEPADLMYILARRITGCLRNHDVYSIRCANESSTMLATILQREIHRSAAELSSKRTNKLIALLDRIKAQPNKNWDRSTIAHEAHMSERNLSRVFQRTFNMPPAQMVLVIRMDLSTQLLSNTDMTLSEIATTVGYDSPFSFSRLFKKYVGVSPHQFRMTEKKSLSPDPKSLFWRSRYTPTQPGMKY